MPADPQLFDSPTPAAELHVGGYALTATGGRVRLVSGLWAPRRDGTRVRAFRCRQLLPDGRTAVAGGLLIIPANLLRPLS